MIDLQVYNVLDEALMDSAKDVKPLFYINPLNEKEQKEEFLASKENPKFKYRTLEYDPKKIILKLDSIEIPDDTLGRIFNKKKEETLLKNKVIIHRGNEDIVREATITIYGIPDQQLTDYADKLLKEIPNLEAEKTVPSAEVKQALEDSLVSNGITEWSVEFSDKRLTTIYPAEKRITVCQDRKFAEIDPARLGVHEIGVHTLRAANGYQQPLKIFATGLPGYLPTEEGLSSYFEELTGNTSAEMIRDYAARVIAVDSVCQGLDFRMTFNRLKSYDLNDDQAWNLAVRAHRGGGFIKDHVYLEGLVKVKDFTRANGDLKTLYLGKIGIEDLPMVKELLQAGILKEAKYLPQFII